MQKFNYKRGILITDIHFGVHSNSFEWFDRQMDYYKSFLIPILEKIESAHPGENVFCILGDIFESRQSLNLRIAWEVKQLFNLISKIMPIHMIVGNHDIYYVDKNEITSVDFLTSDRILVWKEPEIVQYGKSKVLMMPWRKSNQEIEECVSEFISEKPTYLFCHCDINGIKTNMKSPAVDYGIESKIFKQFKKVYSGHIHLRQELDNILMMGNNQHTTRADIGNDKYVDILNFETGEHKAIKNTHSPQFIKFDIKDIIDKKPSEIKELVSGQLVDVEIDHLYLIENGIKINMILKEVEQYAAILKTFTVYSGEDGEIEVSDQVVSTYDINEIINEFINKIDIGDDIKNRAKLESRQIMDEIKTEQKNGN